MKKYGNLSVLLIGCGKMGEAVLDGWLEHGLSRNNLLVADPSSFVRKRQFHKNVRTVVGIEDIPEDYVPDIALAAVKPQIMEEAIAPYKRMTAQGTVVLSVAAGKTIPWFENILGKETAVVRSMPNTPAAVKRAMVVACANKNVSDESKSHCDALLSAVGKVAWIDDESHMDAVTAVSGSGPAYVFYLVECMENAGIKAGLPPELARKLARHTVSGAGELMFQDSTPVSILRENVTSPGGTTAAALDVLKKEDRMLSLMVDAIKAATERSREIAG